METKGNSFYIPISNRIINLLGNEVIELLINSSNVAIYDIDDTVDSNSKTITSTHIYGYKINEAIKELAVSTKDDLKSFFLGLSSYNWAGPITSFIIEPGFAIAFGNSDRENLLIIFICFRCGKLRFQWGNGKKDNDVYFSGYDILLILLSEAFKDSEKVKSVMINFQCSMILILFFKQTQNDKIPQAVSVSEMSLAKPIHPFRHL